MKNYIILIICFCLIKQTLIGRVSITTTNYACNFIELSVWDELLAQGKDLPETWNDIPSISEMNKNISDQNVDLLKKVNSLAIVPGAPSIKEEQGISRTRWNYKLFAISREWNLDYAKDKSGSDSSSRGRFVILVNPGNSGISTNWIVETEAQLILNQIGGFDPKKQPIAFETVTQLEREKKFQHKQFTDDIRKYNRKYDKSKRANVSNSGVSSLEEPRSLGFFWIICLVMVILTLVWAYVRK